MKFLEDITYTNKRVLIRVDYNVPIENGMVLDDYRITQSLPTINYCLEKGASVILMTHLGRPNGKKNEEFSVKPVADRLERMLGKKVHFSEDCISKESFEFSKDMNQQKIHLLENLRFYEQEEINDKTFSEKLSLHGDIYINDAFGTAHRSHASNSKIVDFFSHKCIGKLFQKEYEYLSKAVARNNGNLVVIIGGKKIETKIHLVENLLKSADKILIGGAMAYPLLKEKGFNIGGSYSTREGEECAKKIVNTREFEEKVVLPVDHIVSESMEDKEVFNVNVNDTEIFQKGFDVGVKTIELFNSYIDGADTILWNGPVGVFENKHFGDGTSKVIRAIERATSKGVDSIVGGGDSVAAIKKYSQVERFTHVSTGGGASLMLLSGEDLPAIRRMD